MLTLGITNNGAVVYDRSKSHIHASAKRFLPEALAQLNVDGPFHACFVDLERPIGRTGCVLTGPDDEIVYAKRHNRDGYSRFVLNRMAVECTTMMVVLKRISEQPLSFACITAFVAAEQPEVEPWDPKATHASRTYWGSHALIWDPALIVPGSVTSVCPW